jgi:molybdopterin molybdotransferase
VRDHSKHIELSRLEAIESMLAHCIFNPKTEYVAIDDAYGRTLAEDMYAAVTLPNSLTCRMDSVAVHWDNFKDKLPDTSKWVRGNQWQFANTGVAMPKGFDTAVVVENVEIDDDENIVFLAAPTKRNAGTAPIGSRMKEGTLLVQKGLTLTPLLLAHIASGGHVLVPVLAKPIVAFIPTGDELVPPTNEVPLNKNIESNSIVVKGKVIAWGGTPLIYDIVPDDPKLIQAAVWDAVEKADIVVLNAGSSKGSDDWTMEILEDIGEVLCHETDHGPGHHSSYSLVENTPIIGISGPPMGAAFTTDFYLKPVMDLFLGRPTQAQRILVRLEEDMGKSPATLQTEKPQDTATLDNIPRHGEDRPFDMREDRPFFTIRHLTVSQASDGVLTARPASSRPGAVEADSTDAYYALPSFQGAPRPSKGDLIEVELRATSQL